MSVMPFRPETQKSIKIGFNDSKLVFAFLEKFEGYLHLLWHSSFYLDNAFSSFISTWVIDMMDIACFAAWVTSNHDLALPHSELHWLNIKDDWLQMSSLVLSIKKRKADSMLTKPSGKRKQVLFRSSSLDSGNQSAWYTKKITSTEARSTLVLWVYACDQLVWLRVYLPFSFS